MSLTYDYYPAVLYAIERISLGATKTRACDEANITIATFDKYVEKDAQLQEMLSEAVTRGNDAMADALLDPVGNEMYGQEDPKVMKIVSDNIKWLLGKRDQKRFGDKVQVDVNVTADRAIVEALQAGRRRTAHLLEHKGGEIIDAVVIPADEEVPDFLRVD
jgi:hypothetical protein